MSDIDIDEKGMRDIEDYLDKFRMQRSPKLNVAELEALVQLVSEKKVEKFREGNQEQTEFYQKLQDKLQKSIIKE